MIALFNATTLSLLLLCLSGNALAFERDKLLVWVNQDKGFNGVAEVGKRFQADTGITVEVATPDDLAARFDRQANTAKGPDIVIFAHDRFGSWLDAGHLAALSPSPAALQRTPAFAWEAVSVAKRIYGYPLSTEVVSLIYNRDLVPTPPRTWGEVIELDQRLRAQGKRAIEWDYANLYFSWPIIAGSGGYSLRKRNGLYDFDDPGIANSGAIAGFRQIQQLLELGVLSPEASYGRMMDAFKAGELAMMINGPWVWNELRAAGLRFGAADVPGIDANHPGKPFVGVVAAAVNAHSPNQKQAQRFLDDYLTTAEGLRSIDADKPLGAVANLELLETLQHEPLIAHTYRSATKGEIMPDVPEMKRFWALFESRLKPMLLGERPIPATLEEISGRLSQHAQMQSVRRRFYPIAEASDSAP
ncbi:MULTISPECIES: maltose/maltodextrin ABC transporter substrate-binding protein MalE [Pseudomonadaceae]|uniref:maltose/maltodextrin ABC transporter substrate-binding protein MalE n=1 Tax=Pseudomonadaceae TaxID=135621 RepID=UPI0015E444FA|nr:MULTISPECIES: maltose/maltodextrin ABC transporter substrate-binding protein MalE [Pseudomonadaceae]MBA1277612.1 maltose/maltodextrin ABC transporter substrate-binding protein MalE [Stutzerimonas stutzeri]MBC8650873.1 maltose/maltodextrin ABC transporter substrate-binding protein MalE [Pseudomonas sp. MT4]QXY91172.1 maltose/maltodextrin ABC transporter substrate-binding protein MalE [Pseudomonas sp. MTM4]